MGDSYIRTIIWRGHNNGRSGTATWTVNGIDYSFEIRSFEEAMRFDKFLNVAMTAARAYAAEAVVNAGHTAAFARACELGAK